MSAPVEFYFDFSSPYGYFAACGIDALAAKHSREVSWRPILLGVVFKTTGGKPLPELPLKGDYARIDMHRCARQAGIPFKLPAKFPIAAQVPSRAVYWAETQGPRRARQLGLALYRALFAEGRDISDPEVAADVAAAQGLSRQAALAALNDPAIKDRLRQETENAMKKGVFGSPYFIADGEPFWGADRMEQLDRWLATGGW